MHINGIGSLGEEVHEAPRLLISSYQGHQYCESGDDLDVVDHNLVGGHSSGILIHQRFWSSREWKA